MDGFVPTENLRFREESLTFKVSENAEVRTSNTKRLEDTVNEKTWFWLLVLIGCHNSGLTLQK